MQAAVPVPVRSPGADGPARPPGVHARSRRPFLPRGARDLGGNRGEINTAKSVLKAAASSSQVIFITESEDEPEI